MNSLVVCLKRGISSASGSLIYLLISFGGSPFQSGNLEIVEWLPFLAGLAGLNEASWSGSATTAYEADFFKISFLGTGFPYFGTYFPWYGPSPMVWIGALNVPNFNLLAYCDHGFSYTFDLWYSISFFKRTFL